MYPDDITLITTDSEEALKTLKEVVFDIKFQVIIPYNNFDMFFGKVNEENYYLNFPNKNGELSDWGASF